MRRITVFASLAALLFSWPACPVYAETTEVRNLSNRRYLDETLAAIQNAGHSIFLVMYHIPLDPSNRSSPVTRLVEALIEAKARGVAVRVILDQEIKSERSQKGAPMKNLRAYHFLKENGVSVSFDSLAKRTHAKLLVIDEEVVILGSTHWSREALDQNYEASLWVRSPEAARAPLEDFKSIELLGPEKAAVPDEFLRVSRSFLRNKNLGPRLLEEHAERAFKLYLILISKASASPLPIDYDATAKLLGINTMSREAYRRQIIKVLKKLDRDYHLIRFEPRHGKEALATLLDPARPGEPYRIPSEDSFELSRGLFSLGWLHSLSLRAFDSLVILYDRNGLIHEPARPLRSAVRPWRKDTLLPFKRSVRDLGNSPARTCLKFTMGKRLILRNGSLRRRVMSCFLFMIRRCERKSSGSSRPCTEGQPSVMPRAMPRPFSRRRIPG